MTKSNQIPIPCLDYRKLHTENQLRLKEREALIKQLKTYTTTSMTMQFTSKGMLHWILRSPTAAREKKRKTCHADKINVCFENCKTASSFLTWQTERKNIQHSTLNPIHLFFLFLYFYLYQFYFFIVTR